VTEKQFKKSQQEGYFLMGPFPLSEGSVP